MRASLVVDTSVAAKWVFEEPQAQHARGLLRGDWDLQAPDFLDLELDHVVAKKHRRGQLPTALASKARGAFSAFPVVRHDSHPLRDLAFDIACTHRRGTYDALFVALAIRLGVKLVTADWRLYAALSESAAVGDALLWIEELPAAG